MSADPQPAAVAPKRRGARRWVLRTHTAPTAAGWVFLAATVLVALVAVSSQLAMLFVFLGAMVGALYVSELLARRTVGAVGVGREAAPRCRQYDTARVEYLLRSVRRGGTALGLRIDEQVAAGGRLPPAFCPHLPAGATARTVARFLALRRGRFALSGVTLSTTFPLGLTAARRRFQQSGELIVWPARGRLKGVALPHGSAEDLSGPPSAQPGGQDEFYGVREYRPGDSPRWIHWRRSAGRAQPVVREMSRPQPCVVWVVLDTQMPSSADAERDARRERAIRFAATLAEDALARGFRVGLAFGSPGGPVIVEPLAGEGHARRLLDALAGIGANAACPLAAALHALGARRLRHARTFVVRLAWNAAPACGPAVRGRAVLLDDDRLGELFENAAPPAPREGR